MNEWFLILGASYISIQGGCACSKDCEAKKKFNDFWFKDHEVVGIKGLVQDRELKMRNIVGW